MSLHLLLLLLRGRTHRLFNKSPLFSQQIPIPRHLSSQQIQPPPPNDPRSNLSTRLSFVFDQIDAIDHRPHLQQKDQALQLIRQWRQSRQEKQQQQQQQEQLEGKTAAAAATTTDEEDVLMRKAKKRKEVEVVHPWPEWIELMERLGQQNYFLDYDQKRAVEEEERLAESVGIDLSEVVVKEGEGKGEGVEDGEGFDFTRDWITVRNACMNFGKDRFDILR